VLRAKPLHGAAIVQHIPQLSREELHVEKGSLYPILQKLLPKGWVRGGRLKCRKVFVGGEEVS